MFCTVIYSRGFLLGSGCRKEKFGYVREILSKIVWENMDVFHSCGMRCVSDELVIKTVLEFFSQN